MSRNTTFDFKGHFPNLTYRKTRRRKFFRKEISLLFIVGVIGCLGTLFIFNKAWFIDSSPTLEKLSSITISSKAATSEIQRKSDDILSCSGLMLVNSNVYFTLNNYNPSATYRIHFGDGTSEDISSYQIEHQYEDHGNFQVEVTMYFKNQKSVVHNSSILIKRSESQLLSGI